MKIIKRIAEEQYCFTELQFDSLEEYKEQYPKFALEYIDMKNKLKQIKLPPEPSVVAGVPEENVPF